jgi:uncharacterized protein YhfF
MTECIFPVVSEASMVALQQAWARAVPAGAARHVQTVMRFGDLPALADELASLVVAGRKAGTAGLLWAFEADGRPLPAPGTLHGVVDWSGAPMAVVETTAVEVVPYHAVTEAFAACEGEGDLSLRFWREAHWDYFCRECARIGRDPATDMPVVCHRFRLVYVHEQSRLG